MKFSYPKIMFIIRTMTFLAILTCILFLISMGWISNVWLMGFSGVFILAILVAHTSPMFTQHEISNEGIRLKHGLNLNTIFPYDHIETVEIHTSKIGFLGPISRRNRIVLASGKNGLVRIKLNHKKRFGMLLMKKGDEIIIDLDKPDEFVKLANNFLETK